MFFFKIPITKGPIKSPKLAPPPNEGPASDQNWTFLILFLCIFFRLGIARWFVNRAGGFNASQDVRKAILSLRKEAAQTFHQLHKLSFFDDEYNNTSGSGWKSFVLAMTAVNLTEASGKALPKNFRCLVYAYLGKNHALKNMNSSL